MHEAPISRSDLARMTRLAGDRHAVVGPTLLPDDAVIRGHLSVDRCRSGLLVHAADTHEIHDLTTKILLKPALVISIALEGHIDVSCGGLNFTLGPRNGGTAAEGRIWSLSRPDHLTRSARRGSRTRKVNISIEPDWFEAETDGLGDTAALYGMVRTHLAMREWQPSKRAFLLAEQIINPPRDEPLLRALYVESRAIELVAEAVRQLAGEHAMPEPAPLSTRHLLRARRICDYVESRIDQPLTLAEIAVAVGVSASSLQRLFKQAFGMTVIEFVRSRRLLRARDALEREGVSIAEAAHVAGFTSPANFATAFKRAFGAPPSRLKD
jgi:AraC-like DNA-binding protein